MNYDVEAPKIERVYLSKLSTVMSRQEAGYLFQDYVERERAIYSAYQNFNGPVLEFLAQNSFILEDFHRKHADRTGYRVMGAIKVRADEYHGVLVIESYAEDLRPESRAVRERMDDSTRSLNLALEHYAQEVKKLKASLNHERLAGLVILALAFLTAVGS